MLTTGIWIAASMIVAWAADQSPRLEIVEIAPSKEVVGDDAVGLDVHFRVSGIEGSPITVMGVLESEAGTGITSQESYFRSALHNVTVETDVDGAGSGVYRFSGEAIRMAMIDGPWRARLHVFGGQGGGEAGIEGAAMLTPAFDANDFGEQIGRLVHAEATLRESRVTVRMVVDVSERFEAHATAFIGSTGEFPWTGENLHETVWLEPGMREIVLACDVSEAIEAGIEPPYSVVPSVSDVATLTTLQPRQATVPARLVADWHPVERRRRDAADREGRQ